MERTIRPTTGVVAAALLVLAVCFALRCAVLATLYDGDMELFVYMGKIAGDGGRIGIELIDNKLPTVSLVMWLPYQIIGAWWPGYAWLGITLAALGVFAIARAAADVQRSSLWPTAAMAAAWMSFPLAVFSAFKLEHVTVPLAAGAAWAFVRCCRHRRAGDALFVGLLAGVAAMAKPNALAVLVAAGAALLTFVDVPWRERLRLAVWMAVGLAIPAGVTGAYLIHSNAIDALPDVYRQIRAYNQNSVWQPGLVMSKALTVAFLIAIPIAMRAFAERRRGEPTDALRGVVLRFALGWLAIEAIGIAMQGRMYGYHFLPITAPAALLFGLIPRRPIALSVLAPCAPVLCASVFWAWTATLATEKPADKLATIEYLKSHAAPGDTVWMDEYARLLVESDLRPGSRVPLTFIFSNDDNAPGHFGGMLRADLHVRRPRYVVLPSDCTGRAERLREWWVEYAERPARGEAFVAEWRKIEAEVHADYAPVALFGEHRVYERRTAVTRVEE